MPTIRVVCDDCGDEFDSESEHNDHLEYCSDCDRHFCGWSEYEEHMEYCDTCDRNYCPDTEFHSDCDDESYGDGEGIHNYSFKPAPDFRGSGNYFLGVELEISARGGSSANPIYEWAASHNCRGLFYCKEDSSVQGFEIVTHPMSPTYFESVDWDAFMAMLNETYPTREGRESSEHGLHVHISRSAFRSPVVLARWSLLLNRSSRHVERIARRSGSSWAQFRPGTCVRDVLATDVRVVTRFRENYGRGNEVPVYCDCDGCAPLYERYRAIIGYRTPRDDFRRVRPSYPPRYSVTNMTNDGTVEVRAFQSTRNADEFRDSVRLVYASADYVATHATSAHIIPTWDAFTDYVRAEFPEYFPTVCGIPAV